MIDNPAQVGPLRAKLEAALPLPAMASPPLLAILRRKMERPDLPARCRITAVHYAGDEGGIVCGLEFEGVVEHAAHVSITHLTFDRRLPLAREIAAYQKHRSKRLRRENARRAPAPFR